MGPAHDTSDVTCPSSAAARGLRHQPRHDDRQRRPPDARTRTARIEQPAPMDRRRLQPCVRGLPAGGREPVRPHRSQGHAARRARAVRRLKRGRRVRNRLRPADPRALFHGPRCRNGLPGHPVADLEHLHRTRRARTSDRPLGRDRRNRDSARADRRRVAARPLHLGKHLLRDGTGRRARRLPGGALRADIARCRRPGS